jgi:hypothetical protein
VTNIAECGAEWAQVEFLPVEIRQPVAGLTATVTVSSGPTAPPGIGRLGFFFTSGNGDSIPCPDGAVWPTSDTFQSVSGQSAITGYVVLDQAVTSMTPHGRPDVFTGLQLKISNVRQMDDRYALRPLTVDTPSVGQLCPEERGAVCAPLW